MSYIITLSTEISIGEKRFEESKASGGMERSQGGFVSVPIPIPLPMFNIDFF
jgi:hypothetical protein